MEHQAKITIDRIKGLDTAHAEKMELQRIKQQHRIKKLNRQHEQNKAKLLQQENSFRESFDYDDICKLIKIVWIGVQIILLPMFIASFIVKAALFPRNSALGKLFNLLDFFSIFGE